MSEVVLPRRVARQPSPALVQGGDCGACVLAGIFGLSVLEAYERWGPKGYERYHSFGHNNMADALRWAEHYGIADRAIARPPLWPVDPMWMAFGIGGHNQCQGWSHYLRLAMDAGYYGVAEISYEGVEKDSQHPNPNHWVLLCGWRPAPDKTILDEVLVSCSAKCPQGYWIPIREFLVKHGGYNVLLARPKER